MRYKDYIKSEHWRLRKQEYLNTHPKKCVICGISNSLHLHHKTYKRLFNELDSDLMLVCSIHHAEIHSIAGSMSYAKRNKFLSGGLKSYQQYKYGKSNVKITTDKNKKRKVTILKRTPNHFNWYELNKQRESSIKEDGFEFPQIDIGDIEVDF